MGCEWYWAGSSVNVGPADVTPVDQTRVRAPPVHSREVGRSVGHQPPWFRRAGARSADERYWGSDEP